MKLYPLAMMDCSDVKEMIMTNITGSRQRAARKMNSSVMNTLVAGLTRLNRSIPSDAKSCCFCRVSFSIA